MSSVRSTKGNDTLDILSIFSEGSISPTIPGDFNNTLNDGEDRKTVQVLTFRIGKGKIHLVSLSVEDVPIREIESSPIHKEWILGTRVNLFNNDEDDATVDVFIVNSPITEYTMVQIFSVARSVALMKLS